MTGHTRIFVQLRAPALALVLAAMAPAMASAQSPLADLKLEELMKLDAGQVFGASERLQPVTEAPASVSFVTAEDIERFGYRTLADILRGVRGLYVSDDRNFSFVGARGFGKPGDYNSRILLLVNGHRVNDNVFGQAEIGAEFGLDPAVVERVEIIRGPASALYGDSAFFAVINVITKSGASLNGGSLALDTGTLGTRLARAAMGHRFANGVDLAVSGTYEHSDGAERLYYPAFDDPLNNNGVAEGLDAEGVRQFYSRIAFGDVTMTAAYGTRHRDVPTGSFGTLFNSQQARQNTTDRHTLLDAEYRRTLGNTRVSFRGAFDQFSYDGIYPMPGDPDTQVPLVGHNAVVGSRWSASARVTRSLVANQMLTAGVEYIDNIRQNQDSWFVNPGPDMPGVLLDIDRSSTQHAVYVQDEIKLTRSLMVNAGMRYDGYEEFTKFTPRMAVIFMPSAAQSFKYLYGRAFRAPNGYELNTVYFGDGVLALRPESIDTHEVVWERYTNDWLRTAVSAYWYGADRLITLVEDPTTFFGTTYVNQRKVEARGLELEGQLRLKWGSQAMLSYAVQNATDRDTGVELPNSPRHLMKGRISLPSPSVGSFVSIEGLLMSSRRTLGGEHLPAAGTVNVTAAYPLARSLELVASVRNLFDVDYADPASSDHRQDSILQNGRTARIGVRLKLWAK
jgi:outer membrane receptor for ferrienterochelin and colicins